jgi:glycosyltransferase involved in cell wall biosynthesis
MKKSRQDIVISPSGQLYGSENVLFDFLIGSKRHYKIFAPQNSQFLKKLKENNFKVSGFKDLKILYFKILLSLIFKNKNLILNEAGHIRYLKIIAKLFPKRRFVVIIRLIDDCNSNFKILPVNIILISVSNFIKENLKSNRPVYVILDPFILSESNSKKKIREQISIGIIGRISESKGLNYFFDFVKTLSTEQKKNYRFLFFGTYDLQSDWFQKFILKMDQELLINYKLMGFEKSQGLLYGSIDVVLHFNKQEALGRILFEAINHDLPFLCFRQGGTGELAIKLGLIELTFESVDDITYKLQKLKNEGAEINFYEVKELIKSDFSSEKYAREIEQYL